MNYSVIKKFDTANGLGVRVSIFVSGCTHHCKGCFNAMTWDFNYGQLFTEETEAEILEACAPDYINGLTLLGGEPWEPDNQRGLINLLRRFKFLYPNKNIWSYSGFLFDTEIKDPNGRAHTEVTDEMLSYIDVLVDGRFVLELKDISLRFKGSSNQRIIDVQKSLKTGEVVLLELD
jgi:anaerobic ribonucleoside-triphosphate reductase activating protein